MNMSRNENNLKRIRFLESERLFLTSLTMEERIL